MDNLQYPSTVTTYEDALMLRFDGTEEDSENPDEVLARRLKNRERQRRYRARKREQDTTMKSTHYDQRTAGAFLPAPLQIDGSPASPPSEDRSVRVHSLRNWKKDARKANGETKKVSNGCGNFEAPIGDGFVEADENPAKRVQLSRRQWKSDARNKKG